MGKRNHKFNPIPVHLSTECTYKDHIYRHDSAKTHIVSYSEALLQLWGHLEDVRLGRMKPSQKGIAYYRKCWNWAFWKTVRFFTLVLESFDSLHSWFDLLAWQRNVEQHNEKQKTYMRKKRGNTETDRIESPKPNCDLDLETEFLDAMMALAKSNPIAYRAQFEKGLRESDPVTLANFEKWKAERDEKRQKLLMELNQKEKIEKFDVQILLGAKINEKTIVKVVRSSDHAHCWFENGSGQLIPIIDVIEALEKNKA